MRPEELPFGCLAVFILLVGGIVFWPYSLGVVGVFALLSIISWLEGGRKHVDEVITQSRYERKIWRGYSEPPPKTSDSDLDF